MYDGTRKASQSQRRKRAASAGAERPLPDPRVVALVKFLARLAAEQDYERLQASREREPQA